MKNLLLFILITFFVSCGTTKTVYIPVNSVHTITQTVHDTVINFKLDVLRDSIVTKDTLSVLSNKYAVSSAKWSNNQLYHSLSIKDIQIPIKIQYINTTTTDSIRVPYPVEKVIKVNVLTDWQKFRLRILTWLFVALGVYGLWKFRKPLLKLIFKV